VEKLELDSRRWKLVLFHHKKLMAEQGKNEYSAWIVKTWRDNYDIALETFTMGDRMKSTVPLRNAPGTVAIFHYHSLQCVAEVDKDCPLLQITRDDLRCAGSLDMPMVIGGRDGIMVFYGDKRVACFCFGILG